MNGYMKKIIALSISSISFLPSVFVSSASIRSGEIDSNDSSYIESIDDDIDSDICIETTTETTEMVTTESLVTTTEPVDVFKDIRFLENLSNNDLSIEELDNFIIRYCELSKLSYDVALDVLKDNIDTIESDYISIRGGIMVSLFDYSTNNGILSPYTENRVIREDMTQEEKENIMLEFCDNLCLSVEDKYIVLSAFRE